MNYEEVCLDFYTVSCPHLPSFGCNPLVSYLKSIIYKNPTLTCRLDLRDPATVPLNFTKSINLALSERGINGLRKANVSGLLESVLEETIPMHGRMIHGAKQGEIYEESQNYDIYGRVLDPEYFLSRRESLIIFAGYSCSG